ncbi:MAG: TonB-dependent receptor, partial [Gammaproteobacteria bacterium]|nr:TonB-dependent receptor [Gammaproteobacteria bacterium]
MSVQKRFVSYVVMTSITAITIALMVGPVVAQEAESVAQESDNGLRVEEIVVTARKKAENLQDVPMAITAFSAEGMERAGISSLADVAAFTPGLTFSNLFGEFLPVPVIRGISPTAIFGENNVAVFIDGVFVSGREGLNASQLDLERIEVLKGPQSTKYGRNAFAGAINYVTARPGDELEGEAKINIGNYDKRQARVSISGPLMGDKLTGRIAFGIDEWSGSYNNSLSNLDIGGYQYKTLQTSLWFTPTDTLDIQWAVYLSDDEIDDSARSTIPANCEDRQELSLGNEASNFQPLAPNQVPDPARPGQGRDNPDFSDGPRPQNFCGTLPSLRDNTLAINDQATGEERELIRTSLNINWDVGWGTLAALTGYSSTKQQARADSNQTQDGTVPFLINSITGRRIFDAELTTVSTGDETTELSQELRYSSPLDLPVRFDVGAYWYEVEAIGGFTDFTARLADGSGQRLPSDINDGLFPGVGVVGDSIWGPRFANSVGNVVPEGELSDPFLNDTESWSGFAGLEVDFGERLSADVGMRYSRDTKQFRTRAQVTDENDQEVIKVFDETRKFDYWTWRAGLKYQITDNNMIYTSVSNGKKSGGMDILFGDELKDVPLLDKDGNPVLTVPGDPNSAPILIKRELPVAVVTDFSIEELTAFEVGNKGTIGDGRAQYDLAIFYNDWVDILMPQILDTNPETGLPFVQPEGVDLTGGDATTFGMEASLNVILTENWDISLGGSWTEAEYDDAELAGLRLWPSFYNLKTDENGNELKAPVFDNDGNITEPGDPEYTGLGEPGDIKGNELLRQSKWTGFFTLNYSKPISGDWEFYSRSDVLFTGAQWVGADNQVKVPANTNVNQRLGIETESIRLEFWVNNLLDQDK